MADLFAGILIVGGGRLANRMMKVGEGTPIEAAPHVRLNITEPRQVYEYLARAKNRGVQVVVNCAAMTDVNRMESWPLEGHAINSIAPGFLAVAAEALDMKLLQVSTDYVFGGGPPGPYGIWDRPFPVQQYGLSKLRGEIAVRLNDSSVIARVGWLFGPEYPASAPMLAAVAAKRQLRGEFSEPAVWDDIAGTPTHVEAAARVLLRIAWMMHDDVKAVPRLIHVGPSEKPTTWYQFLEGRYPMIKKGTSAVNNLAARRPRNGGLIPSPEGITMTYGQMLDLFQAELRAEEESVPLSS